MPDAATIQHEMFAAVEERDFDRLRELTHPDYTYTGGDGVEQAGADAAVAVAELYTTAFPDLRFEIRASHAPSSTAAQSCSAPPKSASTARSWMAVRCARTRA